MPAMFEWPRFAAHLNGIRSPAERVVSLLADLAEPMPTPSARDVLSALFEDRSLVDAVAQLAPRVHHVGFVAPRDLGAVAIEELLRESPFRSQLRKFKSAILAKELSSRLGREVDVMILQGRVAGHPARCPAVEIFIADLPAEELESLVAQETGCHVALALEADGSLDQVCRVLHVHGCWEIPLMRNGPLANHELRASVLYVDVPRGERARRLEVISSH
jgi:hypothetical protein